MAQQARPNSMYHWEEARPQLRISSTLVVKTVSGNELSNGLIQIPPKILILPLLSSPILDPPLPTHRQGRERGFRRKLESLRRQTCPGRFRSTYEIPLRPEK